MQPKKTEKAAPFTFRMIDYGQQRKSPMSDIQPEQENINGNGNANGTVTPEALPFEAVPVQDLARELAITLPRLQRLLKRPEFARSVHKGERQTQTGTRTVTLVNVSIVPALREQIQSQSGAAGEQKREQKRTETLALDDERTRVLVSLLMQQAEARIQELSASLSDVRAERDRLLTEQERERKRTETLVFDLQAELSETRLQLAAKEQEGTAAENTPETGLNDTETGDTSVMGEMMPEGEKKRGFWARLFGKKDH